jgi:diguanylate cyclase (GGDEF)-like protein/PAS domain S-box-containing protein
MTDDRSGAGALPPAAAVLVVDDNAAKRMAVLSMLKPLGHEVIEADSGREALRAVMRQSFAVILMDVRMPTLDGYETAKLIRQRSQSEHTPIIFFTAYGQDETETHTAYASGAVDFIFTPVRVDILRAKVSAFVELYLQAQELQRSLQSITSLNAALRESEVRARAVIQNVGDGIVTAGPGDRIESLNRSARRLFGYSEEELIGRPLRLIIAAGDHTDRPDPAWVGWSLLAGKDIPPEPTETVGTRKDGSSFPIEVSVSQIEISERPVTIACIRDISGRRAFTEALERRTLYDELTGLPNRTLFADRVEQAIAFASRADEPRGVLIVDVDGFRELNETLGRERGDAALRAVGDRLRGLLRESDTVARLGDDEFAILPSGETDVEAAAAIAWKVRDALALPLAIDGGEVQAQASVGIAFFPQHGRTSADLLRRADLAVTEAKRTGNGLAVYATEPEDQTARRLTLLSELRDGIPRGELVLHYQPKIDLATRRTIGVEALVRWQHPTAGLLMPAKFMPEAERSELIEPLTTWVLDAALKQQREWRDAGRDLTMAVNVSAVSLAQGSGLPNVVARLTERWGAAPGMLILELTESALIDADAPVVLDQLHAMGERLSIDDFGTGHSSLVYLQRLPIDQIKIDRSFVMNLATNPGDAVIVRSTIDLAHNLGVTVVAEGVEDPLALDLLIEYGCESAQGFYFSRPRSADDLAEWLGVSAFGVTSAAPGLV